MAQKEREPCPDRILDDVGGAFAMGGVGGGAFHFMKGLYNSPAGARLIGGTQALRMNAPRIGGSFAVWGGLYSAFDCTLVYARQKEDPWNSILSGAATAGLLAFRQGFNSTGRAALCGGALLALIEGVNMMTKNMSGQQNDPQFMQGPGSVQYGVPVGLPTHVFGQSVPERESSEEGSGSWFGGMFGSGKKKKADQDKSDKSGSKTQILESFDAPPVPTYEF